MLFYEDASPQYLSTINIIYHTLTTLVVIDTALKLITYRFFRYIGLLKKTPPN
jgi:hypothetical protein